MSDEILNVLSKCAVWVYPPICYNFTVKKILIVVDMEGIAGIPMNSFWATVPGFPTYFLKRRLLIKEVNAAITGILKSGKHPQDIVVLDWHWNHHNFSEQNLPKGVQLIRQSEGELLKSGLIEKVFLIGFHGAAQTSCRYAHTMRYAIKVMRTSAKPIGEASLWAYVAGSMHIPIAFVTGDSLAIQEIKLLGNETVCVETKNEKETPSPTLIYKEIEKGAEDAAKKIIIPLATPSPFAIEFIFKSKKLTKNIPKNYFSRKNGEYIVIENQTAVDVYNDFREKIYTYLKKVNPLYLAKAYLHS
jgi:D-aminopeptidase